MDGQCSNTTYLGLIGGILMIGGLVTAIFGYSGIWGLLLILIGALAIAASVIMAYQGRRAYTSIPSVSAYIPETSPSLPVDQQPPVPSWYSTPDTGQMAYGQQQYSSPQVVNYSADAVPQPLDISPSAPNFHYRDNDDPPPYSEVVSNRY